MQLSVVIPLYNEEDSLTELHEKIISNLENFLFDYEIIFIDDGSIDSSWSVIKNLCLSSKKTKGVQFLTNYGNCLLYTSPSPRDRTVSRMPSSA